MMEGLGMGRQRVGSGEVERGVVRQGGCGLLFHSLLSGPQPYLVASALKHAPIDIEDMKSCGVFDVFDNEKASKNLKVILRRYQTGAGVLYSECHGGYFTLKSRGVTYHSHDAKIFVKIEIFLFCCGGWLEILRTSDRLESWYMYLVHVPGSCTGGNGLWRDHIRTTNYTNKAVLLP